MPTQVLSAGLAHTISDTTIRALPVKACSLYITAVTATSIDLSNASDMSNPKNFTPAAGQPFVNTAADVAAGFIRVNGGSAIVRLIPK